MILLIDTNVILDFLLKRDPFYESAAKINVLSEKGYIRSYISASAVTDIFYIANKELKNKLKVIELLKNLFKTVRIASVTEGGIHDALILDWEDFEDSVQYVAGMGIPANYIVTRNLNDYAKSQIEVVSPEDFLKQITSKS